jgi:hypothetical protein
MRTLLASAVFLVLTTSVGAASPALAPRVTLAVGSQLGSSNHPDGGGLAGGVHARAELQLWWLLLGATAGVDAYPAAIGGAPAHARSTAAHLGMAVPLYRRRTRTRLHDVRARAAVELGRHNYSVDGKERQLLNTLGGDVTYGGAERSVRFTGERAGLSYAALDIRGTGTGVVFALDLVRRSDRHPVDLAYDRQSCGGLLSKGCFSSSGVATLGGHELSLVASVGFVIGR